MSYSAVTISNEALAEIRAPAIVSLDEESVEARECKRIYQQVVDEIHEAHEWGHAGKRLTLAATSNDRPAEWAYCYALPTDHGTTRRVLPTITADSGVAAYPYTYTPALGGNLLYTDFAVESGKLYTNMPNAVLEYGTSNVSVAQMPALVRRAISLAMASRLAMTLRESPTLEKTKGDAAALALSRAMADDINRQTNREEVDDVAAVRDGAALGWPAVSLWVR